jgi:hypothetical protein
MDRAGRGLVPELRDGSHNPAPGRCPVIIAGERQLIGSCGAFVERSLAVALEHELRRSPNIDLGYHNRENCTTALDKGFKMGPAVS